MPNKKKVLACIIMICCFLQGCFIDRYAGKRPIDQENSIWISENPNICFEVSDKFISVTGFNTYGKILIDGEIIEIAVSFDYGTLVEFSDISAYNVNEHGENSIDTSKCWLFIGKCSFSKDKLIVTITKNNNFLDKSIKKITFIKKCQK